VAKWVAALKTLKATALHQWEI